MQERDNPYFKKPTLKQTVSDWFIHKDGWAYVGSAVLVLGFIAYLWIDSQWMWVTNIQVSDTQYIDQQRVIDITNQQLDTRTGFILPQRFYPITKPEQITAAIQSELNGTFAFESLEVRKEFPNTVVVSVTERVPGLVYILNDQNYYIDDGGVITEYKANPAEVNPQFPRIRDRNTQRQVAVGQNVLPSTVVNFIIELNKQFTKTTQLDISEFAIQPIVCKEKQFVAEEILANEIDASEDEAIKQQKRDILDKLQNEEISIDESLKQLEAIKQAEAETGDNDGSGFIQLQAQYVETTCQFERIIHDVTIVTQSGLEIYFDSTLDIANQLRNLQSTLASAEEENLQYIDVRFTDRSYYK